MTIKEYCKKIDPSTYEVMENDGEYEMFRSFLFPMNSQFPSNLPNYLPFEFIGTYGNGGSFAESVSYNLYENYGDIEINEKYVGENETLTTTKPTKLQRKMRHLLIKYQYKWHGLYETTQVDEQYDMLDNVNEIFDETTTRTPDLAYSENESNVFGQHETTQENVYGAISKENENIYGQQTDTKQIVNGARTDTTSQTIGALSVDTVTNENKLNDTTNTEHKKVPYDLSASKLTDADTVTNTYGDKTTTTGTDTSAQSNSGSATIGGQTNSETDTISAHTDTLKESANSHTDNLTNMSKTHTDTKSATKTETGEEETVITRRRHGNIGVTTSGQLIEDYRKTHHFDLVKIIADDIANEILSMVWGC